MYCTYHISIYWMGKVKKF